jgi:hypothetical protein
MVMLSNKDKNNKNKNKIKQLMKKNKHNFYRDERQKLMSLSSPMLCGSHFYPFSPISQVEQWPQAKRASPYQAKC